MNIGDLVEYKNKKGIITYIRKTTDNIYFRLNILSDEEPAISIKMNEINDIKIIKQINIDQFLLDNLKPKKFKIDELNYYINKFHLTGNFRFKVEMSNEDICPYFEKPKDEKMILSILNEYINNTTELKTIFKRIGFFDF